jgi:glycogen operon protein
MPTMGGTRFLSPGAKTLQGIPDIGWFDETGSEMTPDRWHFSEGRLLALRRITGEDGGSDVSASLLLLNAFSEDRDFVLPAPEMPWRLLIDAAQPMHGERSYALDRNHIHVCAHSAVLLIADHVTV